MLSLRNDGVWKHFTQLFHVSTREAINKTPCPIFHTTYKCDYQDLRRAVFQVTSQGKNGAAGKWNNHQDNYFLLKHAQLRETATVPCALSPRQQHIKKEKQLKKNKQPLFFQKYVPPRCAESAAAEINSKFSYLHPEPSFSPKKVDSQV